MGKQLKTTSIKGKAYVTVNERLKHFRSEPKLVGYRLVTEVVQQTDSSVITMEGKDRKKEATITLIAKIINPDGDVVATGMAHEQENAGNVNKGSHVENCETSAWGRALANFGIGIDAEVASADEVANQIKNDK
jgi:hypothetical protein